MAACRDTLPGLERDGCAIRYHSRGSASDIQDSDGSRATKQPFVRDVEHHAGWEMVRILDCVEINQCIDQAAFQMLTGKIPRIVTGFDHIIHNLSLGACGMAAQ